MAYDSKTSMSHPSPVADSEHRPSPWVQHDHAHHHHRHSTSFHSVPINNLMDPESEDSDVSATDGDYGSSFSFPINLPPAPSKPALENQETIAAHLKELERVEAHNVQKHERLKEKRARKDERIARKRLAQDEKIKVIMEARARRDSRVNQRRQRENIAFQRFYEDLDEEETRLQTRLKRLKRGHLVEESGTGSRRVSMNSISPTIPSYSTVPPPSKRHQTSHPSHSDGPPYHPPAAHQPSYQFHQPSAHHTPTPYHSTPQYQSPSYRRSPPVGSHSRIGSGLHEGTPKTTNGQIASPHVVAPAPTPTPTSTSTPGPAPAPAPAPAPPPIPQAAPPSHPPPPRQSNATYDTRPPRPPPPPPHASAFAAVNQPPNSGFAAVNSIRTVPPATPHNSSVKEEHARAHPKLAEQTPARTSSTDEKPLGTGSAANKRTPSTTHPYQMSEAFANRHHHCERTDSLNRGIWTWYGVQGSKDHPTAPPTEMYLVCNHDGCRRIDWRTVHGLQCHIVKNHEQPKGTIGSLEKALAAYGVPVREIENHEREHGPGTGGTMADPKNSKVRTRAKDVVERRDPSERDTPVSGPGPYQLQKLPSYDSDSPHLRHAPATSGSRKRSHSSDEHVADSGSENTLVDAHKQPQPRAVSGFPAVNSAWASSHVTPSKPPQAPHWQTGQAMRPEKPISPPGGQVPPGAGTPPSFWPSWQGRNGPNAPLPVTTRSEATGILTGLAPDSGINVVQPPKVSQQKMTPSRETQANRDGIQKEEAQQGSETGAPTLRESEQDMRMSEAKADIQDTLMTNTTEDQREKSPKRPPSAAAAAKTPNQTADEEIGVTHLEAPNTDRQTPSQEDQASSTKGDRKETRSPEMSHKRIMPTKRESRRSSMAATPLNKIGSERSKDDDAETTYTANTASKAESVDDDSDSITVNVPTATADKHKDKDRDSDRTKTPIRLPNGRFSRTKRTR